MIRVKVLEHRGSNRKAKRQIRRMARAIKNPSQAHRQISVWLMRWVNQNFKTEGGKVGGWKPFKLGGRLLPDGTIDKSAKLLQDTGRLRASFSPFHSRQLAGVGSDVGYSLSHELGLPHRNLPARHMLPGVRNAEVDEAIIKIYGLHINRALR
jgi:phage gpG-like protein